MKMNSTIILFASPILFASLAFAEPLATCPPGTPNPLNNTNWAFHWESSDYHPAGTAAIGTFSIATDPFARGGPTLALKGTTTVNAFGRISRLASTEGRVQYQCGANGLLRGGTLQFSDGNQGTLWQFTFSSTAWNEMYMVNEFYIDNAGLSRVLQGSAVRIDGQQACNANPMLVLDNATSSPNGWSFHTESAMYAVVNGTASSGYLDLSFNSIGRSGLGALTGNLTTSAGGLGVTNAVYRLMDTSGRYQVYGPSGGIGCAGATLSVQVGPYAVQYEGVFADGSHSSLFLLSTNATAQGSGDRFSYRSDVLKGFMKKF